MKRTPFHLVLLAIVLSGQLFAQGSPDQSAKDIPLRGQTIYVGVTAPIMNLDPQKAFDWGARLTAVSVHDTLYRRLLDGQAIAVLASAPPTSRGPGVFHLTLCTQTNFHNNYPVTSKDVDFTLIRLRDRSLRLPTTVLYEAITAITPVDEHSLDLAWSGGLDSLVDCLSREEASIVSSRSESAISLSGTSGSGPFFIRDWEKDGQLILERFPHYWRSAPGSEEEASSQPGASPSPARELTSRRLGDEQALPYLARIVITQYSDRKSAGEALLKGRLHVALDISSDDFSAISSSPERFSTVTVPSHRLYQLYLNRTSPIFAEVSTRKVLSWSIDRSSLVQKVFHGLAREAFSPLLPGMVKTLPPAVEDVCIQNVPRMQQTLQQLGYNAEHPFTFTLIYTQEAQSDLLVGELSRQWKERGFTVTVIPMAKKQLLATVYGRDGGSRTPWDVALEDWYDWRRLDDPLEFLKLQYLSTSAYNKTGFSDSQVDQLLTARDASASSQVLPTVLTRIMADCRTIPLVSPLALHASSTRFRGLVWSREGVPYLDACWLTVPSKTPGN